MGLSFEFFLAVLSTADQYWPQTARMGGAGSKWRIDERAERVARIEVNAPPDAVYALVSDLPGMSSVAEEFDRGTWLGGAREAAVGARFRGHNRARRSTAGPPRRRSPTPSRGGGSRSRSSRSARIPVSRWQYDIEPTEDGCRVAEQTWDRRPSWFRPLANLVTGVRDRAEQNRRNIELTLRQLKAAAEAARD